MKTKPLKYYLDPDGVPQPIEDSEVWMRWFQNTDHTQASDTVRGVKVVTFFLGIDQGLTKPELFETVITLRSGAHVTKRYSSRKEALHGHDEAKRLLSDAIDAAAAALDWASH